MSSPARRRRAGDPRPKRRLVPGAEATAPAPSIAPELAARRVAVRNPRGQAVRPDPRERVLTELREQTQVGEVLLRSLIRAQLALAFRVFAVFGSLLLGLPALFATHPGLAGVRLLGLPLPWLILGAAVYPLLVLMALLYVRQAERNERDFVDLIERS